MDIKPIGPGNIGFGKVDDASSPSTPAKPSFSTLSTQAPDLPPAAEMEALAGLGKIEDLNDPEKSRAIVRNALEIISGPELSRLTPQERDQLTEWMANDPTISGRTLKLMSKVLRGD